MGINITSRRSTFLIVIGAAVLGLASATAFAQSVLVPAGVATEPGGEPAPAIVPDYPTNDAGQTYGSLNDAVLPENEPDLILVEATNGAEGYVLKEVLDEITGANISSPEEAMEWERKLAEAPPEPLFIPVFETDGVTSVGSFEIAPSFLDTEMTGELSP